MNICVDQNDQTFCTCTSHNCNCSELQSLDCLPVFTHSPASLSKCYCTSRCPSLDNLRSSWLLLSWFPLLWCWQKPGILVHPASFNLILVGSVFNALQGLVNSLIWSEDYIYQLSTRIPLFSTFYNKNTFVQYGEKCGGFANAEGVCSGGLGCLVSFQISDDNLIGFLIHTFNRFLLVWFFLCRSNASLAEK